jgi:pimeloyl-ACP methyl ester carboxylesterase
MLDRLGRADVRPVVAIAEKRAATRSTAHPTERVLTAGLGRLLAPTIRESLRQGQAGWARDNVVRMARWDFDLAAIRCRATFWMGEEDGGNVEAAPWLVAGAQHAELRVLADQGHFVAFERWDDVLSSLGV